MKKYEILPEHKMDLIDTLHTYAKGKNTWQWNRIEKPAALSDHEVYRTRGLFAFDDGATETRPDYVMFLEKTRNGIFGPRQTFIIIAYDEKDIAQVAKEQCVFSKEELEYMEVLDFD